MACRGKDAKESEGYTDALAASSHQVWALQVLDGTDCVKRKPQSRMPSMKRGAPIVGPIPHFHPVAINWSLLKLPLLAVPLLLLRSYMIVLVSSTCRSQQP